MSETVHNIIQYSSESHSIDFKMEQYPIEKHEEKHELLKDISAMANHPSKEDKYIIIGVIEKDGIASEFRDINNLIDQAKYQQYIDSSIEPNINFEYKTFEYNGHKLAYFRIHQNVDRPYLIKKEIKNAIEPTKVEFREGDGFIRVGTSTKKLTRKDFDKIYKLKYQVSDRKSDIKITPYFGDSNYMNLAEIGIKYFDISIENTSHHSISLDVEMKVYKDKKIKFISEHDLKKELIKENNHPFGIVSPEIPSFHVDINDFDDHILISRTKFRNEKTAIIIPQNSTERDVFCQYLFIIQNQPNLIKADILIRSDDFSEGILIEKVELMNNNYTLNRFT